MSPIPPIPQADRYWLIQAHVPLPLLVAEIAAPLIDSILVAVDIEIAQGQIRQIVPTGTADPSNLPSVNLQRRLVWSGFVDLHTHLDKGHIWPRTANPDGSFESALTAVQTDREQSWQAEDVYRRMEFGLKCSYAHGTHALRTHIDAMGQQAAISLEVFKTLQAVWADRLVLQAASLVPLEYFMTSQGEELADRMASVGGVLGGLPEMNPDLDAQLDRVFTLAQERGLNLDFHTDESGNPTDITLQRVAAAALRHGFSGQIVCGHCCSLAVQPLAEVQKTLEWVRQAGIGIVSLPMCNLYLQDRNQQASRYFSQSAGDALAHLDPFPTQTPRWRGITLVHELKHAGIPVAFASDNCRDPFYAYGNHDGLEVFTQAVRIAQLDAPHSDWCRSVTTIPADLMGLPTCGRIGIGLPADLIVFHARYFSELLARPQSDRIVLRRGIPIDTTLPDYAELDDLVAVE
ncbi:MAG: cytosine deaminase [Synechococcales cyanobacterium C42_A2020_086]|jgi:cytosine deaminase|nr:cytosine deaminase [Synechococcales cyanobacterium C42_A2020_086]